ncbi:MAG: hypothetical protein D3906_15130, partial [Candidatus Electrothrix sp. AUS1_2]|nr:hypothetical protein [Candidatus Electrothrix sp. AUS1_2]
MKRPSLVLVCSVALSLAGYLFIVHPKINRDPSEKGTQETVRLIYNRSLYSAGADFLATPFIRGFINI